MFDIRRLKVSLTKHGAHKVAKLVVRLGGKGAYNAVLSQTSNVRIDPAQAAKTLAIGRKRQVPAFWNIARELGSETVNGLVLVGIIFSHARLIAAMKRGGTRAMQGTIAAGIDLSGKAYTNFANNLEELGFAVAHTSSYVSYDLRPLLGNSKLGPLTLQLITQKFLSVGLRPDESTLGVCRREQLNQVFSTSSRQFLQWLEGTSGRSNAEGRSRAQASPLSRRSDSVSTTAPPRYAFRPGHRPRKVGSISIDPRSQSTKIELRHNKVQTALYARLSKKYGVEHVGTEIGGIDLVVETNAFRHFYEIKIAAQLRICIREALTQLLEYTLWRESPVHVDKLVIVSTIAPTNVGRAYLRALRDRYGIPVYYQRVTP